MAREEFTDSARAHLPCRTHRQAFAGKVCLRVRYGVLAEMENAGSEDGIGFPFLENAYHVVKISRAAAGNDRDGDGFANGPGERDVIAVFCAVGVHAGEEDFTRTEPADFGGPGDGVEVRAVAAAVGIDLPCAVAVGTGIDGDDNGLIAEGGGSVMDGLRILDGGSVQADFVCSRQQQRAHVGDGADAAAHGEGHEAAGGGFFHNIKNGAAPVGRGGDIEKDEFVRALVVIGDGAFHGIAGIAEFEESGAFNNTAPVDIKAGDDAAR